MLIDGLEYFISEKNFNHLPNSLGGGCKSPYFSIGKNWYDKTHIRVYNMYTKEHFFLEQAFPKIGDSNLLFVDFPRSDAPTDSWASDATQHANIRTWANHMKNGLGGDFIRYKILNIDQHNYCKASDEYNEPSGAYALDAFYKIHKIISSK